MVFLAPVQYRDLFTYTVDADLCLTLLRPKTLNFKYSAGASNKRFESMACGVPQVSDSGPGLRGLIENTGVGVCLPRLEPEALGRTVSLLLENDDGRSRMGRRARRLHLERLNYETEFEPVLDFVHAQIAARGAA